MKMNRREFVKTGAGALAGVALGASGLRAEDKAPSPKRNIGKAIMYATVPGNMSVMDKFKMIRDAGFEGVEPMGGMDRDEVMKARDASGLKIPSVCVSTHWVKPLSDPNPSTRAAGVEGLKTALQD